MSASARLEGGGGREGARRWRRLRSVAGGRGSRGRGRVRERVREFQRSGVARMEASGVSRWSGKQEVAGACAGVRRPCACAYWREEEGDRGGVEMGWAVLGQVSGRQVS